MREGVEDLVLLPRRVVPQPTPELVPGGDCGACVLAGALGLTVEDVYARLQDPTPNGKPTSFGHHRMSDALKHAFYREKLAARFIDEMPTWAPISDGMRSWGNPGWMVSGAWWAYLRMALEAGYYALTIVDIDKKGPLGGGGNHWVMLCGTRLNWTRRTYEHEGQTHETSSGAYEVLVSCSSRRTPAEEWVEAGHFLRDRGGFFLFLVKPAETK